MLSRNNGNRPLDEARVSDYEAKMREGKWHEGGSPIIITSSGELRNGQHRLVAIVRYGQPVLLRVQIRDDLPTWKEGIQRQHKKSEFNQTKTHDIIHADTPHATHNG